MGRTADPSKQKRIPLKIFESVDKLVQLYRNRKCIRFEIVGITRTGHRFSADDEYLGQTAPEKTTSEVEFDRPPPAPIVEFKMPPPAPVPIPPPTQSVTIGTRIFYVDKNESLRWEEGVFDARAAIMKTIASFPNFNGEEMTFMGRKISTEPYTAEYKQQVEDAL